MKSDMNCIPSKFVFNIVNDKIIFNCQSNTCKNAPEAVLWIKKILRKNEINFKLNTE